jgi:CheY-like chemotaxis protein
MDNSLPTVVVIDDSVAVRNFFKLCMAPLAVQLETFGSAAESLPYLTTHRPHLLFLDIIMPDKDGLTFLQELRRAPLHHDTPVVIISSKDYRQDRSVAKDLGATEFVTKPMGTQVIQDLVIKYTHAMPCYRRQEG